MLMKICCVNLKICFIVLYVIIVVKIILVKLEYNLLFVCVFIVNRLMILVLEIFYVVNILIDVLREIMKYFYFINLKLI